ncbi:MAG: hypothetical protein SFT93_02870 [Rickettsiaceae bacterium]|nr:hypothetical protein [Rickettsiaceae bacterium]
MLKVKDLYTHYEEKPINIDGTVIGTTIVQYETREYNDVRNLDNKKSYLVNCTQRIVIPNMNVYDPNPSLRTSFTNYPVLLTNNIAISGDILHSTLISYTPKTLNTSINTDSSASNSSGSSTGTSFSKGYTSGSSTSQTNSYGVSISAGFIGFAPTANVSADYSSSSDDTKTNTNSSSSSNNRDVSSDSQFTDGSSMSIKDWGSYAIIDQNNQSPTWVWGQEYPWNVMLFNYYYDQTSQQFFIPDNIMQRLFETNKENVTIVSPPSQLSLFGVDFVSKASWIVTFNKEAVVEPQIQLKHELEYITATHQTNNNKNQVSINNNGSFGFTSETMDLRLLALEPLGNGSVTGFLPDKFAIKPQKGSNFSISSGSNNLLIRGGGFTEIMSTDFSDGTVAIDIFFKVIDSNLDYTLYLKCWKTTEMGSLMNIVFNKNSDTSIVKHIDSQEAQGGEENLIAITLRNKDYASLDYHDYLNMGLNQISITITPSDTLSPTNPCGFAIRALAIG